MTPSDLLAAARPGQLPPFDAAATREVQPC